MSEEESVTKKTRVKKTNVVVSTASGEFQKELAGKLVTFYLNPQGTQGVDMVEGVPMCVIQDPTGRYVIKFFEVEGSRTFLYLDQVSVFSVQDNSEVQQVEAPPMPETANVYNQPLGGHLPDNMQLAQYSRRGGIGTMKSGPVSIVPKVK